MKLDHDISRVLTNTTDKVSGKKHSCASLLFQWYANLGREQIVLFSIHTSTWTAADASGLLSAQTREKGFSLNISQSSSCASPSQPVTNATRVTVGCKLRFSATWRRWDMG